MARPSATATAQRTDRGIPAIAITGVTVIDVANGTRLKKQTVVVRGTRIAAMGRRGVRVPAGARVVDGRGRYLIPGLWDMHVHSAAAAARELPLYLAFGVTGVRGMPPAATLAGPRFVANGPILDGPGSNVPGAVIVRDAGQARRAVDSMATAGVDFITLSDFLPRTAFFGAVTQARHHGLIVSGHVPYSVSVAEAAEGGLSGVEQMRGLEYDCSPVGDSLRAEMMSLVADVAAGRQQRAVLPPARERVLLAAVATRDESRCMKAMEALRRHGTWVVPTLGWSSSDGPAIRAERANIPLLRRAGVSLMAGTDAGDDGHGAGVSLHDDLEQLVATGLTPIEALRTATMNPARFLRASDSLGTVEKGNLADLVLLDADPLANIRNTRKIRAVIANGRLYDRKALNALLEASVRAANPK
jgi:hypothetical protein